jgi:hypothetical protein
VLLAKAAGEEIQPVGLGKDVDCYILVCIWKKFGAKVFVGEVRFTMRSDQLGGIAATHERGIVGSKRAPCKVLFFFHLTLHGGENNVDVWSRKIFTN